ncbi:MAG: LysM peptidoglycan-binding domain-containing protein [Hespellia sp.]|nr:LysM peptidoglycan-binding domain-containing protein [Hespellia sp.]
MERKLPKNVRQIGNVSDNPKIYIEDYVDTFLIQLCEQSKEEAQGAFLIGDVLSEDGQDYIFIYGAVRMHNLKQEGTNLEIAEETWKHAYEDCKQYFEDGEMIGWFLTVPDAALSLTAEMKKIHKKSFPKKNTVLILEEPSEREESYFANKYNELMHISGHYVYYEKNPCMQNYMISCRKKNGVSPSETVEDRAAKDFRSLVRTREETKEQKKISKFLYVASTLLILIVVALGITTINNFGKMKTVENTIAQIGSEDANTDASTTDKNNAESSVKTDADTAAKIEEALKNSEKNSSEDAASTKEAESTSTETIAQGDTAQSTENGGDGIYVVESGDTLAIISQKCYGDTGHVDAICRMNGLNDGNLIYVGQKLLLP